jgi:thiamine biosynthesis lipoprotein
MVLAPAQSAPVKSVGADYYEFRFSAMGTSCGLIFSASSRGRAQSFEGEILQWIQSFEDRFSRHRPNSLVSRINLSAGGDWVDIDAEAESLFSLCDWYFWLTNGIFDPTVLPLLRLWNYKATPPVIPDEADIASALQKVGWKKSERRSGQFRLMEPGMGIDLGGLGKEYAVDRVLEMALAAGIENILIDFGHDLRLHGEPPEGGPWRIGLEDPADSTQCWRGLALTRRAVTTSGDYLRHMTVNGKRYGHILDPRTGIPVSHSCRAVTVVAPTCTEAGILSTSAFILGPTEGLALIEGCFQAEGCMVTDKHRIETGRFYAYNYSAQRS